MKRKNCLAADCDNKLTGKQRMFCSRACGKRHRRGVSIIEDQTGPNGTKRDRMGTKWAEMSPNRQNSEVKRLVEIQVKLRVARRLDMREFDNSFVGKSTRMRLQPLLEQFFREVYANHYEAVAFKVVIESQYD